MQIAPAAFWRLTLAEWRGMVDGYGARITTERRQRAWVVSHLMAATGNFKWEDVTMAKLLGESEPKPRKGRKRNTEAAPLTAEEIFAAMPKEGK